jgi:tetratricopeptide (TPR) repeat protein
MSTDRLSQLEELLKEDPTDSFLQYGIALEYAKKGNVSEAIQRIEKLLSEKPDYLGAYYQLGQYYEVVNKNNEAIGIYEKGILLAKKVGNMKTMNELREALQQLEEL